MIRRYKFWDADSVVKYTADERDAAIHLGGFDKKCSLPLEARTDFTYLHFLGHWSDT
jgi:hypothetical protein